MDAVTLCRHRRNQIGQSREDYSSASGQGAVWPQSEHALQPDGSGGVPFADSARSTLRGLGVQNRKYAPNAGSAVWVKAPVELYNVVISGAL